MSFHFFLRPICRPLVLRFSGIRAGMSPPKCRIGPSVLNADLADLHQIMKRFKTRGEMLLALVPKPGAGSDDELDAEPIAEMRKGAVSENAADELDDWTDNQIESQRMLDSGADYLHLDVMDGHFVPNLTFGHPVVKCLRNKIKDAFMETHMMVSNPDQWIEPMADAGVDQYTFHVESSPDVLTTCRKVREAGMKVGVALKPKTDVLVVKDYIDQADLVLIMTVEPGFGGQKFMADMMAKVKWLRENYPSIDIEVDGGVGPSTIQQCAQAGANMIVSGTAVAKAPNPASVINELRETVNKSLMSL